MTNASSWIPGGATFAEDPSAAAGLDPGEWAPDLARALGPLVGTEVSLVAPPTPRLDADGPWAFGFELATPRGDLPAEWQGPLVARVAENPDEVGREQHVLEFCAEHGLAVPQPLALLDLGVATRDAAEYKDGDAPLITHSLILRPSGLRPLIELVRFNLPESGKLMGGFAAYHAALHQLGAEGLADSVPRLSLADELARIDRRRFAAELEWLGEHRPSPGPVVLCHGAFNPHCVTGPDPDRWDLIGGAGEGLVVSGWEGAFLAEREVDMAMTLLVFWLAPNFSPKRPGRTAMRMVRNTLSNEYKNRYATQGSFDQTRLDFWEAFHAVRALARLADAYDADGSPFATVDRQPLPADLAPELERLYQRSVASMALAGKRRR